MKMNKKGFTLIELLAVIVILAIIALIATPIIMGIIDEAKKNSARNSAYGYLDAIDKAVVTNSFKSASDPSTASIAVLNSTTGYTISGDGAELKNGENSILSVTYKGDAKFSGTLKYTDGVLQKCSDIVVQMSNTSYSFHTTSNDGKLLDGTSASDSEKCGA